MSKWNYISYDLWGNETDGYEVNQSFTTGFWVELPEEPTDTDLRTALICQLSWTIPDKDKFSADWHENTVYVEYDGRPEGEFRLLDG